jgi:hypothetical protein
MHAATSPASLFVHDQPEIDNTFLSALARNRGDQIENDRNLSFSSLMPLVALSD